MGLILDARNTFKTFFGSEDSYLLALVIWLGLLDRLAVLGRTSQIQYFGEAIRIQVMKKQ